VFFSVSIRLAVQASLRLELSLKELISELLKFIFDLGMSSSCDFWRSGTRNVRGFQLLAGDFALFNALKRQCVCWFLKVSLLVELQKPVNLTVRDIPAC
jgi:hypothetical protein